MPDPDAYLRVDFRGADVEPAVELIRVGANDLAVEGLGDGDSDVRLAGGGGSDDGDKFFHVDTIATPSAPLEAKLRGFSPQYSFFLGRTDKTTTPSDGPFGRPEGA